MRKLIVASGVLFLVTSFSPRAEAAPIVLDLGSLTGFSNATFGFSDVAGTPVDGSTLSLDFVFAGMKHLEAMPVPASSNYQVSIGFEYDMAAHFMQTASPAVTGHLFDENGNNVLSLTAFGGSIGPDSFDVSTEGGTPSPPIHHGVHLDIELHNHPGVVLAGLGEISIGYFGDFGQVVVGDWGDPNGGPNVVPEPTTAVLFGLGVAGLGACRRRRVH